MSTWLWPLGLGERALGAGLAQVPGWLSPSEDIDGCVCQVMGSLRAEAYFPIHSIVHAFTRCRMPLGARQCTR